MAICSIASAKGGCSKTTLAILLGAELALDNYRVAVIDCDVNQHTSAFGEKCEIPGLSFIGGVDETTILGALRQASAENDMVLVDLPGGSSTLALKALQRSNFVLVPVQPSLPDVKDAVKTIAQIADAEELAGVKIARALVWSRVPTGFESRSAKHVRETVELRALPLFRSTLIERAAYREIHITGQVPRQSDAKGAAAVNVTTLAAELLDNLAALTAKEVA